MKKAMMHRRNELSFLVYWRLQKAKKRLKELWMDEEGIGTIELVLILVVLIALVSIFKTQLTKLINSIFSTINNAAGAI